MTMEILSLTTLLQVYDMPTAMRFYRETLGFAVVTTSPPLSESPDDFHWALLRHGSTDLMLNTAYDEGERPPVPDSRRVAAHADTILYFDCPDIDGAYQHLLARGVKVKQPTIASYGMRGMEIKDPDGYALCFHWPA